MKGCESFPREIIVNGSSLREWLRHQATLSQPKIGNSLDLVDSLDRRKCVWKQGCVHLTEMNSLRSAEPSLGRYLVF